MMPDVEMLVSFAAFCVAMAGIVFIVVKGEL
jgi:hypothetical protein